MVTDNPLRNRLHHQIDNLSTDKLRLLERLLAIFEEGSLDTLAENVTEYHSLEIPNKTSVYNTADIPEKINSQEEWFQYFREIEEGEFTPLDKSNLNFKQWKEQHILHTASSNQKLRGVKSVLTE
jgi:hypothetical protein